MPAILRSLIALALILGPSFAFACTPWDPYDYPIRGAYLAVYLSAVIALALELFRLLVSSVVVRRRLRIAAYVFALILLAGVLFGCALRSLEKEWKASLPILPVGASAQLC